MTKITCDAALREKLHDLAGPVELCDESCRVLARVWPAVDPTMYPDLEPQISMEEVKRRLAEPGKTYTTPEVLAYLEQL